MEVITDVVIVGAGISGLATALALHRLGIKSLILESSDVLRATGIAFTTWTNGWRALDALGIGDTLKAEPWPDSWDKIFIYSYRSFDFVCFIYKQGNTLRHIEKLRNFSGNHELRCLKRKDLLEALAKGLPSGTIRYSSKVISIEASGFSKLVHLADGSTLKTKVLIGCDGVHSVVAKWLGFKKPSLTGRLAIRGCLHYKEGHRYNSVYEISVGNGVRYGVVPCDDNVVYWFMTWSPSAQEYNTMQEDQLKLKQFVLSKLEKMSEQIRAVVEDTKIEEIACSPLGYRPPLEIIFGNISKDNVCVVGDACHPMTPELGQGGCLALEDGVILAKCLAEALLEGRVHCENEDEHEFERIKSGLSKYAKKRRWRAFDLTCTSYMLGWIQESEWFGMRFLRDNLLADYLSGLGIKKADFDPKQLVLQI